MKNPIKTHRTEMAALYKAAGKQALSLAVGTLASCGTGPSEAPAPKPTSANQAHWHKVKDEPPTYYPKEVPADHPTSHHDGMLVQTGDTSGTRYFIPNRGVDTRLLVAEALTQVTPERHKQLDPSEYPVVNGDGVRGAVGGVATVFGALLFELDDYATEQNPARRGLWNPPERR